MGKPRLPELGDLFAGKYRVERELRRPDAATAVFEAIDVALVRPVALKIMLGIDDDVMARFVRDAKVMAALESDHVVRVYEVGTSPEGAPFMAMELLSGKTLADELGARGMLPLREACDIVLEACEALSEAHKRGIAHRHLDVAHLFLAARDDGDYATKVLELGTPSSAQEAMKPADARTDVRALAKVLAELLVGEPLEPPATPLRVRVPNAPSGIEALLLRAAAGERSKRFPSTVDFAKELVPFAGERGKVAAARLVEAMSRPSLSDIAVSIKTPPPTPVPRSVRSSTRPSAFRPSSRPPGTTTKPPKFEESTKGGNPGVWLFVVACAGLVLVAVGVGGVFAGKALRDEPAPTAAVSVPNPLVPSTLRPDAGPAARPPVAP